MWLYTVINLHAPLDAADKDVQLDFSYEDIKKITYLLGTGYLWTPQEDCKSLFLGSTLPRHLSRHSFCKTGTLVGYVGIEKSASMFMQSFLNTYIPSTFWPTGDLEIVSGTSSPSLTAAGVFYLFYKHVS